MILSHRYKFIFIKTKKTAGTSMEIALSKFCGKNDIITPVSRKDESTRRKMGYTLSQNYRVPVKELTTLEIKTIVRSIYNMKWPPRFYNHMSACEVRALVGESVWRDYFKFTIARDPIDRAISLYFWTGLNKSIGFPAFLRRYSNKIYSNWEIVSDNDNFILDDFIRYEKFSYDIDHVGSNIGLPDSLYTVFSTIKAKSAIRTAEATVEKMVGPEEKKFLKYLCHPEMEYFGYSRE